MARMKAGLRKHRDGSLERRFVFNGVRYTVQGATHSELNQQERLLRKKLEEGMNETPTLNEYFETWIERKRSVAKQATLYRYANWYRNHISQPLGGKKLNEISRSDVVRLQEEMARDYSPSSVNYTTCILKIILNEALDEDLIEANPTTKVKAVTNTVKTAAQTYHRALTEEEQILFMDAARDSYYYEFFALLLLTGLRHGEATALVWTDIDWRANVIRISRTLTFDMDGHVVTGPPKSRASRREIPMNAAIRRILKQQAEKSAEILKIAPKELKKSTHRVFFQRMHPEGYLNNRTANTELRRILQRLADSGRPIPHFTLHALRDTFATRFIEQGGTPQTLKTILGHSSLAMTMDLYSQVMANTKQKEMDLLDFPI